MSRYWTISGSLNHFRKYEISALLNGLRRTLLPFNIQIPPFILELILLSSIEYQGGDQVRSNTAYNNLSKRGCKGAS